MQAKSQDLIQVHTFLQFWHPKYNSRQQLTQIYFNIGIGSAHAPGNGGPVFPGTFLGHFFFFIKISKLALPGVMLKYEGGQYRKIDNMTVEKC